MQHSGFTNIARSALRYVDAPDNDGRAFGDVVALMVRHVAEYSVPQLLYESAGFAERVDSFSSKLDYILRFIDDQPTANTKPLRAPIADLRAARGACVSMRTGDGGAMSRLGRHLQSAHRWSLSRSVSLLGLSD